MVNYKYKFLKYKLKYKKLLNLGGVNNKIHKIALIGCWNCSLKECSYGNNTIATLDNIIKNNVDKTIFLGDNAYPNKIKLEKKLCSKEEEKKKKFKYYTDELIYGVDNKIINKLRQFDTLNIKYLGIGNHDIEPEYDNKKILKELKNNSNIDDIFIVKKKDKEILETNDKYLIEKSKNQCYPYTKLHAEKIFAPFSNKSFFNIGINDSKLDIYMIDTNVLTEKFNPEDCDILYRGYTKEEIKNIMINELRNYVIYCKSYNLPLIITGHNPIISFKKNELANNVDDFIEILDLIVEIGIKDLIYISADTHNSQLCEFNYNNELNIKNFITGNGGTDLDETSIDEASRNQKIQNSIIPKISNIEVSQFNDKDYGFLMLEVNNNNEITNIEFNYN